jgi:porphobilinogen synthase
MAFPQTRMRRLRASAGLRGLVRETDLRADRLVLPLFVSEPDGVSDHSDPALPDLARVTISGALERARQAFDLGIGAVLLFGIPSLKDAEGSSAWDEEGVVQVATRALKQALPKLLVITDVCLCEYTDHGHCGVLREDGKVDNDASLDLLARTAVSHARAGADIVAPSDMMDGRVGALRGELDSEGFSDTPILAYSAKFASSFYGPFRDAAGSAPAFGDRRSYQLDPANGREAVREAMLDVGEGADMVMVKPALAYGDLIAAVKRRTELPVAAYNVSGEYAMVKAAAAAGHLDERSAVLEILTSINRAGADAIISYHALDAARWLTVPEAGARAPRQRARTPTSCPPPLPPRRAGRPRGMASSPMARPRRCAPERWEPR